MIEWEVKSGKRTQEIPDHRSMFEDCVAMLYIAVQPVLNIYDLIALQKTLYE